MREILEEIVKYTHELGFQKIVVTTDNDNEDVSKRHSKIQGQTVNQSMHMTALFKEPIPNFAGQLGMSNMNILLGFLKSPAFQNPQIDVKKNTEGSPSIITIQSEVGHSGEYRLMSSMIAQRISKVRMAKNIEPDIEFVPTEGFFKDFQTFKAILFKFDPDFKIKVSSDNVLKMVVGGNAADGNKAEFPIVKLDKYIDLNDNTWPIESLFSVLKQAPSLDNCKVQINDEQGLLRVIVGTEHANYVYDIPSVLT